jgi:hypothetical protein
MTRSVETRLAALRALEHAVPAAVDAGLLTVAGAADAMTHKAPRLAPPNVPSGSVGSRAGGLLQAQTKYA